MGYSILGDPRDAGTADWRSAENGRIGKPFAGEGRGIPVTLEKVLENVKTLETDVDLQGNIV